MTGIARLVSRRASSATPAHKRGFVLILVLVIVGLLTIGVVSYNYWVRTKAVSASNQLFDLKTLYLAKAGINYGLFLLQNDEGAFDGLSEEWANLLPFELGEGEVTVTIIDENGKININKFIKEKKDILRRLFDILELESEKIEAIADWIDADDNVSIQGAESDYYQSLPSPYSCKNGPLDTIGELIMVKGIDKEVLYDEEKGLVNFLTVTSTVTSDDKININTAPSEVLEAILDNHALAEEIISQREEKPFTSEEEIKEEMKKFLSETEVSAKANLFTFKSSFFSLDVRGDILPHYQKKVKVIVKRAPDKLETIYYKIE